MFDGRPPETVEDGTARGVETFMAEVVVGVVFEAESLGGGDIELMPSMVLSSPKLAVEYEINV